MVRWSIDVYEAFKNNEKFVCINLIRSKPFPETLHKTIRKCKGVLVVDEQGRVWRFSIMYF